MQIQRQFPRAAQQWSQTSSCAQYSSAMGPLVFFSVIVAEFFSRYVDEVRASNIVQNTTSSNHPQTNHLTASFHLTLQDMISMYTQPHDTPAGTQFVRMLLLRITLHFYGLPAIHHISLYSAATHHSCWTPHSYLLPCLPQAHTPNSSPFVSTTPVEYLSADSSQPERPQGPL